MTTTGRYRADLPDGCLDRILARFSVRSRKGLGAAIPRISCGSVIRGLPKSWGSSSGWRSMAMGWGRDSSILVQHPEHHACQPISVRSARGNAVNTDQKSEHQLCRLRDYAAPTAQLLAGAGRRTQLFGIIRASRERPSRRPEACIARGEHRSAWCVPWPVLSSASRHECRFGSIRRTHGRARAR